MRFARTAAFPLLAAAASSAALAAQTVHVVDPAAPGYSSATLQQTVSAAASGDVVLVRAGAVASPGFTISNKSLAVIADAGALVPTTSTITIQNLAANQRVVLRGLHASLITTGLPTLDLKSNEGPIWIEDSSISILSAFGSIGDTARVTACASVTFQRCHVGDDSGGLNLGGAALVATASNVVAHDTAFVGLKANLLTGGAGARLVSGTLFASGSSFTGGTGGLDFPAMIPPNPGGAGGTGLIAGGAATLLDCTLAGGPGGFGGGGFGAPGVPSAVLAGGSLATLPGAARHFDVTSPAREQQSVTFTFGGAPGENAAAIVSFDPAVGVPLFPFGGVLLTSLANADALVFGVVPPGGSLAVPVVVPNLPAAAQTSTLFFQSMHFDSPPTYVALGPASALVILDASF